MKKNICLSIVFLAFASQARAGLVTYTSSTNTWVYSGFQKTNVGAYVNTGLGGLENDGGVIIGGGSHMLWQSYTTGGGVGTYDFNAYTDYYFPGGYQVEVIGPMWTNTDLRLNNQGEGIFGYQHVDATDAIFVGTPISDGTVLDGIFTYSNSGSIATWSYVPNPSSTPIPAPGALCLALTGTISVAGYMKRRRSLA